MFFNCNAGYRYPDVEPSSTNKTSSPVTTEISASHASPGLVVTPSLTSGIKPSSPKPQPTCKAATSGEAVVEPVTNVGTPFIFSNAPITGVDLQILASVVHQVP